MALVIELQRTVSTGRTGRRPGPRPPAGVLERTVVEDEFWTALERLGRHRLPTLSGVWMPTGTQGCTARQSTGWCGSWKARISLS